MKIIGKIKDVYNSIDQWQQNFRPATKHREDENVCKNCGLHYKGSFCPNCGQTANTKRFTFRNAIMMTLECGSRFLADYINGDTYFKIHRENHNLDRARTQFKLVKDIESKFDEMHAIIKKYL